MNHTEYKIYSIVSQVVRSIVDLVAHHTYRCGAVFRNKWKYRYYKYSRYTSTVNTSSWFIPQVTALALGYVMLTKYHI